MGRFFCPIFRALLDTKAVPRLIELVYETFSEKMSHIFILLDIFRENVSYFYFTTYFQKMGRVFEEGEDVLDQSPLLDIKASNPEIDCYPEAQRKREEC